MASKQNPSQPDQVGPFPVEGHLGTGGMGEVYKVRDTDFDRELALKLSKRGGDEGDPALVRFVGEGRLIGQLQHPSIPPIYHLAQDEQGRWFYTMKRVRGRTLASVLKAVESDPKAREEWPLRRLLTTFVTVCQAVAYAHSRGVIHRDLKPQNIMLGDFGDVYVMDWGLAKVLGRNLNSPESELAASGETQAIPAAQEPEPTFSLTQSDIAATLMSHKRPMTARSQALDDTLLVQSGSVPVMSTPTGSGSAPSGSIEWGADADIESPVKPFKSDSKGKTPQPATGFDASRTLEGDILGTPAYMAPEQARGEAEKHDQRTDVYALGVILWEILTGKPLRSGKRVSQIVRAAMDGVRPNLGAVARFRRVEPPLKDACWKATSPNPKDRQQTAPELADEILKWLEGRRRWNLVYEKDFSTEPNSRNSPEDWKVVRGKWAIQDGSLLSTMPGDAIIHLDRSVPGDVRIEIEGWIDKDGGELSPIVLAPTPPNGSRMDDGYVFQFGADGGSNSKIARNGIDVAWAPGRKPVPRVIHRVVAEFLGGQLTMRADGEEVVRLRDFFPLSGDRVGIYSYGSTAHVVRIRVWTPGAPRQQSCLFTPDEFAAEKLWPAALKRYCRILESHPGSEEADEAAFKASLCLIEIQDFEKARVMLGTLEQASDSTPLAYVGFSVINERSGMPALREAETLAEGLSKASAKAFNSFEDLLLRAFVRSNVFHQKGELEAAIRVWLAVDATADVPAYLRDIIRNSLHAEGKSPKGVEALMALSASSTMLPLESMLHCGSCLFSAGKPTEAMLLFSRILAQPELSGAVREKAFFLRGKCASHLGKGDEARLDFQALLRPGVSADSRLRALYELSLADFELGDYEACRNRLAEILDNPKADQLLRKEALLLKGKACMKVADTSQAFAAWKTLMREQPDSKAIQAVCSMQFIYHYANTGQIEEAFRELPVSVREFQARHGVSSRQWRPEPSCGEPWPWRAPVPPCLRR